MDHALYCLKVGAAPHVAHQDAVRGCEAVYHLSLTDDMPGPRSDLFRAILYHNLLGLPHG